MMKSPMMYYSKELRLGCRIWTRRLTSVIEISTDWFEEQELSDHVGEQLMAEGGVFRDYSVAPCNGLHLSHDDGVSVNQFVLKINEKVSYLDSGYSLLEILQGSLG